MPFGPERTPFDVLGGESAVRAVVDRFYDGLDADAGFGAARALYPPDLAESRQKLFEFLCGWLGGPPLFVQKHGQPRLRSRHLPFAIGEAERDQWMACMTRALDQCGVAGELRDFLLARLSHLADFMRNRPRQG